MQPELFKPGAQFKRSADGKDPTRTPIYCHYGDERFHMLDIPPWGMVLSVELGEVAFVQYFFEIHSRGLPAGTVLGMRWKPEDGKNPHTTTYRMTGQELENVKLRLEDPWILESEGKHVVIEHEIVLPDGTVQIGEPFELGITKRLHWRGMIVGNDLQDRDDLDPSEYPNGLVVHFQPIDNLEGWHPVIQSWSVMAYTDEGMLDSATSIRSSPQPPGQATTS